MNYILNLRCFSMMCFTLLISAVCAAQANMAGNVDLVDCLVSIPDSEYTHNDQYRPVVSDKVLESNDFHIQWKHYRDSIRLEWMSIIGEWPELMVDGQLEYVDSTVIDSIKYYTVELQWMPGITTTGYLLVPQVLNEPAPAVITLYYEPETAAGFGDLPNRDFARMLAERGLITLSLGTTETTANRTYGLYYPSIEDARMESLSAMACAAANAYYALANSPMVDPDRVGVMGHSYGGKWAMFASCLFDKFACAVWGDPGIVFDETMGGYVNYWEPWYLGYRPQPWTETWSDDKERTEYGAYKVLRTQGHDLHELHALMAPRPFMISGGWADSEGRLPALYPTVRLYNALDCPGLIYFSHRASHDPDPASNRLLCDFFVNYLGK